MLLKHGVEPDSEIHYSSIELVNGRSFPLKLARTKGKSHEDIVQLLVDYGSKVEESSQTVWMSTTLLNSLFQYRHHLFQSYKD
jgi:hypothetical protein